MQHANEGSFYENAQKQSQFQHNHNNYVIEQECDSFFSSEIILPSNSKCNLPLNRNALLDMAIEHIFQDKKRKHVVPHPNATNIFAGHHSAANCGNLSTNYTSTMTNYTTKQLNSSTPEPSMSALSGIFRRSEVGLNSQVGAAPPNVVHCSSQQMSNTTMPKTQAYRLSNGQQMLPNGNSPMCLSAGPSLYAENNQSQLPTTEEDCLAKLAHNIWQLSREDHIVINRNRNEVVRTDANTNQKTIYRVMDPVSMGMKPFAMNDSNAKPKVGRRRKQESELSQSFKRLAMSETLPAADLSTTESFAVQSDENTPAVRTRFGRVVRSVQPSPLLNGEPSLLKAPLTIPTKHAVQNHSTQLAERTDMDVIMRTLAHELKDKDYKPSTGKVVLQPEPVAADAQTTAADCQEAGATQAKSNRFVPPQSICPTCNKVFLGRRLERHYGKHPEHMKRTSESPPPHAQADANGCNAHNGSSLFNFLISKLQGHAHLNEDQRADLFLGELNDFIEQLQVRSTRLIRNTSGLHFVNARSARVLGIPEGQYALDMTAIESVHAPEPDNVALLYESTNALPTVPARNLVDYTTALSMSIDDTLTDEAAQKLNLSAGGKLLPPSEESLLRTVDDFMPGGGIGKLGAVQLLQPPLTTGTCQHNNNNNNSNNDTDNNNSASSAANGVNIVNGNEAASAEAAVSLNGATNDACTLNGVDVNAGVDVNVGGLLPHYVHVSDNAVEAMSMKETTNSAMIDLNVDFFQFNKN